jgi:hypothetical protein
MLPARYELGFYVPEDGILHVEVSQKQMSSDTQ